MLKPAACRHCRRVRPVHSRGLCGTCARKQEIRDLFPPKEVYCGTGKLPLCPQCGEPRGIASSEQYTRSMCSTCSRQAGKRDANGLNFRDKVRARIRMYEKLVEMGMPIFGG